MLNIFQSSLYNRNLNPGYLRIDEQSAKYLIVDSFDYDILETPRVIRSRTSMDRQFNDQIKRDEKTSNDLHTTIHKTKDRFNYVYVCYNKSWVFEFYLKM